MTTTIPTGSNTVNASIANAITVDGFFHFSPLGTKPWRAFGKNILRVDLPILGSSTSTTSSISLGVGGGGGGTAKGFLHFGQATRRPMCSGRILH